MGQAPVKNCQPHHRTIITALSLISVYSYLTSLQQKSTRDALLQRGLKLYSCSIHCNTTLLAPPAVSRDRSQLRTATRKSNPPYDKRFIRRQIGNNTSHRAQVTVNKGVGARPYRNKIPLLVLTGALVDLIILWLLSCSLRMFISLLPRPEVSPRHRLSSMQRLQLLHDSPCIFRKFPSSHPNFRDLVRYLATLRHVPLNPLKQGFVWLCVLHPPFPLPLASSACTATDIISSVIAFIDIIITILNQSQQPRHRRIIIN